MPIGVSALNSERAFSRAYPMVGHCAERARKFRERLNEIISTRNEGPSGEVSPTVSVEVPESPVCGVQAPPPLPFFSCRPGIDSSRASTDPLIRVIPTGMIRYSPLNSLGTSLLTPATAMQQNAASFPSLTRREIVTRPHPHVSSRCTSRSPGVTPETSRSSSQHNMVARSLSALRQPTCILFNKTGDSFGQGCTNM